MDFAISTTRQKLLAQFSLEAKRRQNFLPFYVGRPSQIFDRTSVDLPILSKNEEKTKILLWFAKEAMGIEGRISKPKLKQQLLRLGKFELK